jgi:hypothetical protein
VPTEDFDFSEDMQLFKDGDVDKTKDIYLTLLAIYNKAVGKVSKADIKLDQAIAERDKAAKTLITFHDLTNGSGSETETSEEVQ